ncbi:MAG: hypothetical protein RBS05_12530 [Zoogloea oleivorans]|jgi:hypothetical protein|uniref:hypothetical protein n=1 Tax=Zoogloea oleivorans TaxID=1552750 RepID=UPI002A36EA28|nr:hypothetical protein [Zoogloea oleivorans]MDY0036727.1 hypothetical protein [Zoogloea oleivorans]
MGIIDYNYQHPRVVVAEFGLADVTSGEELAVIKLPAGAVITGGHVKTLEAWDSTSTDVIDVGDDGDGDRYLDGGNFRAAGAYVALSPTGHAHEGGDLLVTWTSGGGTPSTGRARVVVEYIILGASSGTFG